MLTTARAPPTPDCYDSQRALSMMGKLTCLAYPVRRWFLGPEGHDVPVTGMSTDAVIKSSIRSVSFLPSSFCFLVGRVWGNCSSISEAVLFVLHRKSGCLPHLWLAGSGTEHSAPDFEVSGPFASVCTHTPCASPQLSWVCGSGHRGVWEWPGLPITSTGQ